MSIQKWAEWHYITDPDELSVLVGHIRAMESAVADLKETSKDKQENKKGVKDVERSAHYPNRRKK